MSEDHESGTTASGGLDPSAQRSAVRERYARAATDTESGCCSDTAVAPADPDEAAREVGYSEADVETVDAGANLGLGCGNPTAIAGLERGEDVLDLGSGGGFDCFLAARQVAPSGSVIGVDMTPEMVERARENGADSDGDHADCVEFRLGEIEHLPVADGSVDVVVSNCVVNLSPDKPQVFREAFRVLRPGGRLSISDVVAIDDIPERHRADPESLAACVAGASPVTDLEAMLADAGFTAVSVDIDDDDDDDDGNGPFGSEAGHGTDLGDYLAAATIEAEKPRS